jgi:DnaJ homolog subfamily C member 3
MASVNEAYEVLSNPGSLFKQWRSHFFMPIHDHHAELRARFDAGEDPMDPMAAQQGHPFTGGTGFGPDHPFAQFFQQAHRQGDGRFPGGGGFQFHFSHR